MKITVAARVWLLVLSAVIGLAAILIVSEIQISKVFDKAKFGNTNSAPSIMMLSKAEVYFQRERINAQRHVLANDINEKRSFEATIDERRSKMEAQLKNYEEEFISGEEDKAFLTEEKSC